MDRKHGAAFGKLRLTKNGVTLRLSKRDAGAVLVGAVLQHPVS